MASVTAELATLRALTFRISSTPTAQLPQHVAAIAASLTNCRTLLSTPQASGSKIASEASVATHKYRTLLATLLQDRSVQGRWAAVILIKSTIEAGGWETLQKSLPWVHGLLGILTKPDPPSSKKLSIITLSRIFILTRDYPTLVREITTPSLPAFVQTCLQIASSNIPASLLQVILESFGQLLPRHPTIFRTYLKQLNQLLAHTVAPTPSTKLGAEQTPGPRYQITSSVSVAARQLYTQLPYSAPKGAFSEDWQASLRNCIENTHRVTDRVFRAIVEDWRFTGEDRRLANSHTVEGEVQDLDDKIMGLPSWSGIFAGGERLVNLLRLISAYLECATAGPINLSVGIVTDLLMRLLSVTVPSSANKDVQNYVRFNNQVSKDERENLWLLLPNVHVAAIEVFIALGRRVDESNASIDTIMLDQLAMLFSAEKATPEVRAACYLATTHILKRSGVTLPKSSIEPLATLIRCCCNDMLPTEKPENPSKQFIPQDKTNGRQNQGSMNADSFLNSSTEYQNPAANLAGLQQAAHAFVTALISHVPHHLSDSLRTRLDRTAIIAGHKEAMIASVLNPPPSKKFGKPVSSILPILARTSFDEQEVEALIKPRMPVIRIGGGGGGQDSEEDDIELEEEEEEGESEKSENEDEPQNNTQTPEQEPNKSLSHEPDSLLETASDTNTKPPTTPTLPIPTINPSRFDAAETPSGSKRQQESATPSSPPVKRARIEQDETPDSTTQSKTPTSNLLFPPTRTDATSSTALGSAGSQIPSPPPPPPPMTTTTTTVTTIPASAKQGEEESDDDDEDVVPLVFGQDTDDDDEEEGWE